MTLAVAEILVAAFCEAIGLYGDKRKPRVDVYDAARRVGASVEHSSALTEDGRVEDSPRSTRILLRESAPEERTRFTLAHELGHLVLSEPDVLRLVHDVLDEKHVDVERMCNAFAAELLMPREWMHRRCGDLPESLTVVDTVMTGAGVSYGAALTRLSIVLEWRSSLLYFQRRRCWAPIVIGGSSGRLRGLEIAPDGAELLSSLYDDVQLQRESINLRVHGRVLKVHGEFRHSQGGILCLGDLS